MQIIKSVFLIYSIFALNDSTDQKLSMYLCLDSMMKDYQKSGKSPVKLVYGYIDGKKTECMSEYELRARYSEAEFKKKKTAEVDSQKLLEKSGKRKKNVKTMKIRDAIFFGKKDLAGVDLRGCDLKGADLSGANLVNANLESADLRGANLSGANLRGASLEFAFLKNANLNNADLTDARLKGAYLHHANLSNVQGLTLDHIRVVTSVYQATLDSEMMKLINEYCPGKMKDPGWQWQATVFDSDSTIPENERVKSKLFH